LLTQKVREDIVKIVQVITEAQPYILSSDEDTFCAQKNKQTVF